MSEGHKLPYGVPISKVLEHYGVDFTDEKKQVCGRENLIGKATLTCIGMKKTSQGWTFSDENRTSKRINNFNNSLAKLHEKMDILLKHFIEVSSSFEGSERRDIDEICEETFDEDSSESE
ncbi:hypothetical protein V8G54_036698 [Vigna mungo]|uniref:Uncharacterized protein n=1 Tax=Vigna mungo TaxID=3915 RepID=A0AAQ3MIY8_VIGMU